MSVPGDDTEANRDVRTVLVTECDRCDEVETSTQIEHPRDSLQSQTVIDAHQTMVDEHAEETGHETVFTVEEKRAN